MTDWDAYAKVNPMGAAFWEAEPVQRQRAEAIAAGCIGTVLDVGCGDGYIASRIQRAGHDVTVTDISPIRVRNVWRDWRIDGFVCDATNLPYPAEAFDTVILGEILEHQVNPGPVLTEACRVAKERMIVTLPLNGWADPTHQWRIRLDHCLDPAQQTRDPTKGEQIVLTWQRGQCWPPEYYLTDPSWEALHGNR